jgi:phage-related protein
MSTNIDSLSIQISANASQATRNINELANALGELKNNSKLTTAVNGLNKLATALNTLNPALNNLNPAKLAQLRASLIGLSNLSKLSNLNSAMATLKKIPDVIAQLDDAVLTKFQVQMERLSKALDPLVKKLSTVSTSFSKLPANVNKAVNATKQMSTATRKMSSDIDAGSHNLMTFLSNFEMIASYAQRFIQIMSNSIATAIEWDGIQYRFGRAFGEQAEQVYSHIERINEAMGINIQEFMQYSSLYGSLLSGFGMNQDKVTTIAVGLTELSYDIWAAYNDRFKSLEQASEAVRSAITGEIEPIRNAGIALTEASLQEYLDEIGMATVSIEKLSEAQKSEVRYAAMMNAAMNQGIIGTYAAEMQTAEGAVRGLSQNLKTLTQSFGSLFIPILQLVIPYLSAFVQLLTEAVHWIAALFGIELFKIDWSSSSSGVGGLAAGAGEAASGLEEAAGAAKKLQDYTMGFDELNVIQPPTASGGGGGGGAGGSTSGDGGLLDLATMWDEGVFAKATQKVDELKENLRDLWGEWKGEILTIGALMGALSISKILAGLGEALGLGDKFLNVMKGIGKAATTGIIVTLQYSIQTELLKGFIDGEGVKKYILALFTGAIGTGVLYSMWGPTGIVIGLGVTAAASISAVLDNGGITNVESAVTALTGLASGLGAVALAIKVLKGTNIGAFFSLLKEGYSITAVLGATFPKLAAMFSSVGSAISGAFTAIASALGISVGWVAAIAAAIVAAIALVIIYWDEIKLFFSDTLPDLWKKLVNWLGDLTGSVAEWFGEAMSDIAGFFSDCWATVMSIWEGAASWFNTKVIQPIVKFFSPIVKWFAEWFGNIWDTVSDVFYNIGVIAKGCWEIVKAAWEVAGNWFSKNVTQPVGEFFSKLWENTKNFAVSAWDGIKSVYSKISGWINDNIIKPVTTFFSNLWTGFLDKAKSAWEGVKSVFSKVGQFFGDTFRDAWKKVVDVFSVAGEIFTDIKDGVVSAFKKIVNAIISGINKVVSVPFNAINNALDLIRNIEILDLRPFSGIRSISVPEIPLLASGGMVNAGQMFVAREAGPELVGQFGSRSAVMNNEQIIAAVSQGVYSAVRAAMSGEGSSGQNVNVYLDGKQIYASVKKTERERGLSLMGGQLGYAY